jgi:hypothetical protein
MTLNMTTRYALISALLLPIGSSPLFGQASLTALDQPLNIDFTNTVNGVNNGLFDAQVPVGSTTPLVGQLDANAWDYLLDGTPAAAANDAASFPGTLPDGVGFSLISSLATGLNASDVDGARVLAFQPTGGHFTSGALTLRVQNNTGAALEQLAVSYLTGYFNDQERSNAFRFLWSASNTASSYVPVPEAELVSPGAADNPASVVSETKSFAISGFNVPDGEYIYLRWVGDDITGSGQRDEFFLTNISLTAQAASGAILLASLVTLPPFAQSLGTPSDVQSFTLSGSGLVDDVSVVAPAPFEVSLNAGFGFGASVDVSVAGGNLPATTLYVRLNSSVAGPSAGVLSMSSPGANTASVNLSGATTVVGLPTLFINELLASNATGITDPNGEFDDWIELYNPNGTAIDLAGWYISDNLGQLTKYQFPIGGTEAIVPANGWLLIWADNQTAQGDLHTNFALSASGESVVLTGPDGVSIVDQITFGPQQSDVSYGRITDGGSPWVEFVIPTPNASNNLSSIAERYGIGALRAWPVPADGDQLFLDQVVDATIHDMSGRVVATVTRDNVVDIAGLMKGPYVLRTVDGITLRFVKA